MAYYLIDPPVNAYDSVQDVSKWIETLQNEYPQDNQQVREALSQANKWLKEAKQREQRQEEQ